MGVMGSMRARGAWIGRVSLSAALAASMVGVPAAAFAAPSQGHTGLIAQITADNDQDPYGWAASAPADGLRAASSLPEKLDPRDKWVTPVKLQNPWGACWSFAVASAAEMSIWAEAKAKNIDIKTPDLSEHHLAWFTYTPLPKTMTRARAARAW